MTWPFGFPSVINCDELTVPDLLDGSEGVHEVSGEKVDAELVEEVGVSLTGLQLVLPPHVWGQQACGIQYYKRKLYIPHWTPAGTPLSYRWAADLWHTVLIIRGSYVSLTGLQLVLPSHIGGQQTCGIQYLLSEEALYPSLDPSWYSPLMYEGSRLVAYSTYYQRKLCIPHWTPAGTPLSCMRAADLWHTVLIIRGSCVSLTGLQLVLPPHIWGQQTWQIGLIIL